MHSPFYLFIDLFLYSQLCLSQIHLDWTYNFDKKENFTYVG